MFDVKVTRVQSGQLLLCFFSFNNMFRSIKTMMKWCFLMYCRNAKRLSFESLSFLTWQSLRSGRWRRCRRRWAEASSWGRWVGLWASRHSTRSAPSPSRCPSGGRCRTATDRKGRSGKKGRHRYWLHRSSIYSYHQIVYLSLTFELWKNSYNNWPLSTFFKLMKFPK